VTVAEQTRSMRGISKPIKRRKKGCMCMKLELFCR